jgi:hypothetical protein
MRVFSTICAALGLAAACLVASDAAAKPRIWPLWSIEGNYALDMPAGFRDLYGSFTFPLSGGSATLRLDYDDKGRLTGQGVADVPDGTGGFLSTIFSLLGTFEVDELGVTHVSFADLAKTPGFTFDGVVAADALSMTGDYVRKPGFLGLAGEDAGTLTMTRTTGDPVNGKFVLSFKARMDTKGRVSGGIATDGKHETTADIVIFGQRPDPTTGIYVPRKLTGGKIKGLVKTDKFGFTTATLAITGPKWSVKMTGPVEETGFHATTDFVGAGFVVRGVPLTLAVRPGPTPPTPPPPPVAAPPYLLVGAQATIVNGAVTLTHGAVPKKFFGATAGLTARFPMPGGSTTLPVALHADPASNALPDPDPVRFIVSVGSTTYSAAVGLADVTLDVRKISSTPGGKFEVLATGKVAAANGKTKSVYVLIDATVQ